ncbi:DUF397 domain-containing protein [Streptomyces sp. NPDC046465]|uniref:DUF397 domain-containing protein n=1 Tax=Streptomyces sp. NPDC046465 TaxID=3155810 RepID=UPI0033CAF346
MSDRMHWLKSSYSVGEGECLEVALAWTKSSHSGSQGNECLELAATPTTIHIRDSKHAPETGPALHISPATWTAFLTQATTFVTAP